MFQNSRNIRKSTMLLLLSCTIFLSPSFFIQKAHGGGKKNDERSLMQFYDQIKDADIKLANLQAAVQQSGTGDKGFEGQGFLSVTYPSVLIRERFGVIMDTLKSYGKIHNNTEKQECKKTLLRYLNNTVAETDIYLDQNIESSQGLLQHEELKNSLPYVKRFVTILKSFQPILGDFILEGYAIEKGI
jgi:hypothetical protein